jgi:shikimate kinase
MPTKSEVIVLIGPMGVGKTTVGRKLAKSLKLPFQDTDAIIVRDHGPIPAIFETLGESAFRKYEESAIQEAISVSGVVATGGGAVLSDLNRKNLRAATVVYLSTNGRHIASRLRGGTRPLVTSGVDDWKRIYQERKPTYESIADLQIDTSGQSLAATVAEIRKRLDL